jgi:acid phosphatase (class A)
MFKLFAAALILSLVAAPAHAEGAAFVTPKQSQATLILLDPPADGSPEQQAELAALHAIESSRTPAQEQAARADADDKSIFVFKTVFGEAFAAKNLPLTAALGEKIARDSAENVSAAKDYFKRIHPYTIDATLHSVCKSNDKPESYPSGHAQLGWLLGLTLVEMVPEQREAILSRAQDYGHNRLVCGVHYPSDVAASRPLAYAIHALMTQNPDYVAQVAAARAELRKALALTD